MVKNLLKKGCLVVSVLLGLGSNVLAQKTSVTFNVSDGGKTMTISGQGDLTTYQTTDFSARVFSDKAVGYVFTDDKGTKVNAGDSYSANNIYYQANYEYTKVCDGEPTGWNGPFGQVTSNKTWKEDKITNLYKGYYSPYNTSVVLQSKVKVGDEVSANALNNDQYSDMSVYFLSSKEISGETTVPLSDLENQGVTLISKVELQNYYESNVTYTMRADAFKSSDGGKTYTGLTYGETYTWTPGEVFYTGTATFSQIKDNGAFFGTKDTEGSHSDYIKADETPYTFAQLLQKKIASGSYETVKFNKASSEDLLINNDIVSKILFITETNDWGTQINYNSNLKTLDLGAATCTGFSKETFAAADGVYVHGTLALTNLTLPLTNKTRVLNEGTGAYVDKMVVPTQVISTLNPVPTTVTIPEGYERVGDEAFANSSITKIIFPKSLTLIGERAFENCKNIASITLNEGLENIGKKAFMSTSLTTLKFPSTLQIIHDEAFRDCFIYGLKFNAGLKFIGKGAFALHRKDKAETTLEIPASMRYIGAIAFGNREYQDVFFYGENAPLMPFGTIESWQGTGSAFDEITLMGNNGFDPAKGDIRDDAMTGYANRENYKNHGVYFCMLHYPKDLTDEQRAAYTDITRVYKTVDGEETFYYGKNDYNSSSYHEVGQEETELKFSPYTAPKRTSLGFQDTYLGRQYIWPSQDEWRRSYVVNSLGYNWNGKDKYLPTLSKEDLNVLAYAGYKVADDTHSADEATGYYKLDDLRMMAHMGTRQFPLVNEDVNVDKEPEKEPTYPINIKGGQWWTICVPFNMTKAQVDNVFGKDTHVCRFNKVERVVNSEKKEKSIKLFFTNDVYVHKSTKDDKGNYTTSTGTSVADADIVIYAHESYMIYPTKNNDDANSMYNISDYTLVTGSPLPTLVKANEHFTGGAKESASGDADWNKEYRFVGNYQTEVAVAASEQGNSSEEAVARDMKNVTVPQYSYIYAKKKNTSNAQFWFYTGTEMLWGANKCVVQATARDGGKSDFNTYFGGNGSARAKELSFFGTDDEVTGIENVEIIAGNENDTQIVYNLNGQVVNGNLNSLQKGIYIKNGKKFMVK